MLPNNRTEVKETNQEQTKQKTKEMGTIGKELFELQLTFSKDSDKMFICTTTVFLIIAW